MRRDRVVAGAVLIAALALVAVPGPAGSRSPGADPVLTDDRFTPVVMERALDGAAPTDDPALRSASFIGEDSILREPAAPSADPARPAIAQPAATAGAESKNPWRLDRNVSWYGPGFYGRRTACGLELTTTLVGVAHRSLPCGTKVTFRNPANGRVVTARVVDRGPYVAGRQWDMTAGLCKALGHCYTGSIQWRFG